ncbi:hypothetical protein HPB52_023106 [Rhipicephalus sanguineus]|uniref:Uncharacterized protein n=1 Tax=Rhipicephalus sanguineus TaxID=34632 RepID=A0A9D4PDY3_RHISA|nr:hypothetical protein HPB52_023106 [Rhipicephalus sanguineus]
MAQQKPIGTAWRKWRSTSTPDLSTTMKLSCFKGPLLIDGKLQLNATVSGATIQAELFVIDCPGPMLCGIHSFNTAGVPDSHTTQPGSATTSTTTAKETSPMPAGMADPMPAASPPSSQPETPPPLRRSNRLRRPPQRFNR